MLSRKFISVSKIYIARLFILNILISGCSKSAKVEEEPFIFKTDTVTVLNTPGSPVKPRDGDFTIIGLPDTQYYLAQPQLGGVAEMFSAQIAWIKNNQVAENIVYVAHLGDVSDHGDNVMYAHAEWYPAKTIMYGLENPVSIPYGIAVGNHDQFPSQYPVTGTTLNYNKNFGVPHFTGRPYYGGHYGSNNDSHYDLFSAGGLDFIVIYIEFDVFNQDQSNMNTWAYNLLNSYSSRKAIIVSHYLIGNNDSPGTNAGIPGTFRTQGQGIYDRLKYCPNVFMMVCGHVGDNGEGYRKDTFQGNTIRTFLSDYQSRENGGNGLMRLYSLSVENNKIDIKTFSPYTNTYETDGDSQFTTPLFD